MLSMQYGPRPDQIISTGVIQPYSAREPVQQARSVISEFTRPVRPSGPQVVPEMQPTDVYRAAVRVARAQAQGIRTPATDSRIVQAAHKLMAGKPFTIKAAGRVLRVPGAGSR